jgi:DNA-directed RNA polymerase specialized sigma24 family protein
MLSLNDAIDALAANDPAAAELVKLRYFTGLSIEDAAQMLGLSCTTAYRHWTYARAWLFAYVQGKQRSSSA